MDVWVIWWSRNGNVDSIFFLMEYEFTDFGWIGTPFLCTEENGWKRGKTPISVNARTQPMFWTSNVQTLHSNVWTCESRFVWAKGQRHRTFERSSWTFECSSPLTLEPKTRGVERSNVAFVHLNVTWAIYDSFTLFSLCIIWWFMALCMGLHIDLITLIIYLDLI